MTVVEVCKKCGKPHKTPFGGQACAAHRAGDRTIPCARSPIHGSRVCPVHGGGSAPARKAAREVVARRAAESEIAKLMYECDIVDQNPIDGLLEVVRVTGGMMRLLNVKVRELDDIGIGEVPHLYVTQLRLWSERYERACKTCLDAGVAERQVRLAESQGELIAVAVKGILTALNLSPEQWASAPVIVEQYLKELA